MASHRINNEFIRTPLTKMLQKGNVGVPVKKSLVGDTISKKALAQANRAKAAFTMEGTKTPKVTAALINGRAHLVTSGFDRQDTGKQVRRFEVRSAREGIVEARGFVDQGKTVHWTRSHNESSKTQKAEINDAG